MNSEFCRLCIRKEKSRLVNALSIPQLCKSLQCFLGLEILGTDKCSTFICRQCISIITESISYRNRVLFNQETIKDQLLLQLQLENVDTNTKKEDEDDSVVINSEKSYQDLDNGQPLSVLQSYLSANSNRSRLRRRARKNTAKLPMMVFPPTKKICIRRLKVVCRPLIQKDVAHVYLDIKTRRLLKLNGKLAVRKIKRKQTKKQMQIPVENDTKGKVGVSDGTSIDVSTAQLSSKNYQARRVEPIKISRIGSTAYRAITSMEKQVFKSASLNVAEIGSIKVQSASEVIASRMTSKSATGTPMNKKNRPNSERLVPFSVVNQRQPSSSKELRTSVEANKINNNKNLCASSAAVTATRTEPRNAAATQTPPTTTSPIVVSPNISIPNLNYGVFQKFSETSKNIETTRKRKLPMVNARSNVSTVNSYHIPASIIKSNISNQPVPAVRASSSSSSMSSPSSPTVKSVNSGQLLSENRVKILERTEYKWIQ